jgi:hypothetical protein
MAMTPQNAPSTLRHRRLRWLALALFVSTALGLAGCGPATSHEPASPTSAASAAAPTTAPATDATGTAATPTPTSAAPAPAQHGHTHAPAVRPTTAAVRPAAPHTPAACGRDYYRNSDGRCVHRPVTAPAAPPGATAKCNDGTYSYSQHRRGTCSGHGGVAVWL